MNRDTLETVYDYFAAIQEKSEEESHILGLLTGRTPIFSDHIDQPGRPQAKRI